MYVLVCHNQYEDEDEPEDTINVPLEQYIIVPLLSFHG